jgi:hypothetical protein
MRRTKRFVPYIFWNSELLTSRRNFKNHA